MGHFKLIASEFIINKKKCFFIYHMDTQPNLESVTNYFTVGAFIKAVQLNN